jgi:hypothetical protein
MRGDHTPLAWSDPEILTSLGANQMHNQGAVFRSRYLQRLGHGSHNNHVGIVGIEPETISSSQLNVEASTDHCSSASAIAFMQGLYPPWPPTTCGLKMPGHAPFANSSILDYPLCGYQFPRIRAISPNNDPDSIWYCVTQCSFQGCAIN